MSYSTSSKYVQLTPYLLMEYMYADQPQPESYFVNTGSPTVGYDKLINGYMENSVQILNPSNDYGITRNTVDDSVVQIATNSFVTLDSNLIIPFNDYSDKLTNTIDLPIAFPSNLLVVYDTVRYHVRAGYNLGNIDGLILQIEYQDQNLNYVTVSQILLKKGTSQDYYYNPNPVTIGSNIYDKYFEIKIPNLKDMNYKYLAASSTFQPDTLASLISQSGNGFVADAPIRISVWQIQSIVNFDGYNRYDSAKIAQLSLEQEDPFSNIGATIKESDAGQFFEYYATDNEGFVEDFILFQNSIGNQYYISHQIEVLEQIGAAIIETSRFESVQTTAYDSPNYYRPIVKNAAYSSSFTLRYTMSLINSVNQSRVIRISTYTSNNPSQWGTTITPIQLQNLPQVQKIYNRVYSQSQIVVGNTSNKPREIIKYTNVFIQQNYVTASQANLTFTNGSLTSDTGATQTIAVGQGKLTITISPFDNYFKFKFVKSDPNDVPAAIDLSNSGDFKISFIDNSGNKTYIPALLDNNIAKPALGELAFKVDETQSTKILQFTDRRFFITNGNVTNTTTATSTNPNILKSSGQALADSLASRRSNILRNYRGSTIGTNTEISQVSVPSSDSSSLLFWGYWKKNGEIEVLATQTIEAIGATGTTGATASATVSLAEPASLNPTVGIVKSITPISSAAGVSSAGTSGSSNTNQGQLSGEELISALSSQIQGYKAQNWTDQSIIDYFLNPRRPGYKLYPGLTVDQFIQAAEGILAPASLNRLTGNSRGGVRPPI